MLAKLPPKEKIYEAWSAIESGRVIIHGSPDAAMGDAEINSSDGSKKYCVRWQGNLYQSTDSATYWQGYPGYPVLAVLMLRGLLPYDQHQGALFANVDWHLANERAKRNYAKALAQVCDSLGLNARAKEMTAKSAEETMQALEKLDIKIGRYKKSVQKR